MHPKHQLNFKTLFFCLFATLIALPAHAVTEDWPANDTAHDLTFAIDAVTSSFEPSGIAWHAGLELLVVVSDNGKLCTFTVDGTNTQCKTLGSDLEGVTVVDAETSLVYLAVENPDSIVEFDLDTMSLTGYSWNLTNWLASSDANQGLEAVTFVPNGSHPFADSTSGGVFYTSMQEKDDVFIFDIDLSVNGAVDALGSFEPHDKWYDSSDMYFSTDTGLLYIIYDNYNILVELNTDGTDPIDYALPVSDQEGITMISDCAANTATVYIADDAGSVFSYADYPIECIEAAEEPAPVVIDTDGDGTPVETDCNDADATVASSQTFYQDLDADGLGSDVTTTVCASVAPSGFVSNSDDTVGDNDFDNDGTITASDCNDRDASLQSNKTYYQDLDLDGLGSDVTTTVCANTAPSGYVSNSDDTNDTGAKTREVYGDGVSNDGDASVDEYNTVSENGDSAYATSSVSSKSAYSAAVSSISGTSNGDILIKYKDNTVYQYDIFTTTTSRNTKVWSWGSTGTLLVYTADYRSYKWINAYTGEVL